MISWNSSNWMPAADRAAFCLGQAEEIGNHQLAAASQLRGDILQASLHLHVLKAFAEENAIVLIGRLIVLVVAFEDPGLVAKQLPRLAVQKRTRADAIDLLSAGDQMSGDASGPAADIQQPLGIGRNMAQDELAIFFLGRGRFLMIGSTPSCQ